MTRLVDLTGMQFGKWTIESRSDQRSDGGVIWNALCECGCGGMVAEGGMSDNEDAGTPPRPMPDLSEPVREYEENDTGLLYQLSRGPLPGFWRKETFPGSRRWNEFTPWEQCEPEDDA